MGNLWMPSETLDVAQVPSFRSTVKMKSQGLRMTRDVSSIVSERPEGGFELRLAGFAVSRCIVDAAFTLQLVAPTTRGSAVETIAIRLEAPF